MGSPNRRSPQRNQNACVVRLVPAVAVVAVAALSPLLSQANAQTVYVSSFHDGPDTNWSIADLSTTPVGTPIKGPFTNQAVALTLEGLPEHSYLVVAFDLILVGNWTGDSGPGPMGLRVDLRTGPTLLDATFARETPGLPDDQQWQQSYPDPRGTRSGPAGRAMFAAGLLGYTDSQGRPSDALYRIVLPVKHNGASATFDFTSMLPESAKDAFWALDNVVVQAFRMPDIPALTVVGPTSLPAFLAQGSGSVSLEPQAAFVPQLVGGDPPSIPTTPETPTGPTPPTNPTENTVPSPAGVLLLTAAGAYALRRRRST
ncbi:MAG: hypothetical protein LW650_11415 [Planctomycetaceae bacterium]|jgi:MYXO-CTERM domain-containing protein|nr:hypothetical protein [Phycisphaerales bacterium]MCE2654044.1 hypothetical protein [Planctomycetaceae bacterium]